MERWVGKVSIITGASSIIRYEIPKHLVNAGVNVWLKYGQNFKM